MSALVEPGHKVAVIEPDYSANRKSVSYLGGQIVPVALSYADRDAPAELDLDQLHIAVRAGAKVILPSNCPGEHGGVRGYLAGVVDEPPEGGWEDAPASKLDLAPGGATAAPAERFEVAFADEDGEQRLQLTKVWSVPFESCWPVRGFPSYKGQRHLAGRWWTTTTGTVVGYESWLERDRLVLLDPDPEVVGIASQPCWLFWTSADGRPRSHAPDYFARRGDGSALVLDVRPAEGIKPRDRAAFEATRSACELPGWRYEVVSTPPETLRANARWLASYRHPRHNQPDVAAALRAAFAAPAGLLDGAEQVGNPIAVLPVLFPSSWRRELHEVGGVRLRHVRAAHGLSITDRDPSSRAADGSDPHPQPSTYPYSATEPVPRARTRRATPYPWRTTRISHERPRGRHGLYASNPLRC